MKRAVTLIEILLVVVLSALLMTVIIPFIRSVNDTWNVGSSKTEILQNGRAALETMTRYIRQAKRITGIPGSPGNYIKIRDREDRYNIIFYHNVSGSPYYIGDSGIIKVNDLVMRSDSTGAYVDSLLASSLDSLTFNFFRDDGTTDNDIKANQVKSVKIQMTLSDPLGSTTHTLTLEDTITLRQDVKISSPVWFAHSNQVGELSSDIWVDGFSSPNSVSVNPSTRDCWVADTGNNRIKKISSTGTILLNLSGFNQPQSVSVNSSTENCWVADTGNNRIKKLSSSGDVLVDVTAPAPPTRNPQSVSVNPSTGECWMADTGRSRIKKLSSSGDVLVNVTAGTNGPQSVSVNSSTGECWVADTRNNRIKKLSSSGDVLVDVTGFNRPQSVSVDPTTGACWVADTDNNRIVRLNSAGDIEFDIRRINNPLNPLSVSVSP